MGKRPQRPRQQRAQRGEDATRIRPGATAARS
jgi:hypothetical protein